MSKEFSTPIEAREELFQFNKERLEQLAFRSMNKGLRTNEFVVVLIDVDDPEWTDLVDYLMPDHNWQLYRDRREKTVAHGIITSDITKYLRDVVPDIAPTLVDNLPPNTARVIVMGSGGASVYNIIPTPQ